VEIASVAKNAPSQWHLAAEPGEIIPLLVSVMANVVKPSPSQCGDCFSPKERFFAMTIGRRVSLLKRAIDYHGSSVG